MKTKFLYLLVLAGLLLAGCEKSVSFKLDDVTPKLVVEATIENGEQPLVYLSKSLGYFSKIDLNILQSSFVHNAEVYVSNGTRTHKLKEFTLPVGNGYSVSFYTNDPAN